MSRNKRQANRAAAAVSNKTEAEAIKENLNEVKSSVKEKVDELKKEAEAKLSQAAQAKEKQEKTAQAAPKASETSPQKTSNNQSANKPPEQTAKKVADKPVNKAPEMAKAEKNTTKVDKPTSEPKKTEATGKQQAPIKPRPKQQGLKNKQQINYAPAEKAPSGGGGKLLASLALLLGVAGTGLGAYSFNELRTLKAGVSQGVDAKLNSLDGKIAELAKVDPTAAVKGQLDALSSKQQAFTAAETRFNERIATVEQMQKGLSQSVKKEIDTALAAKLAAVDSLLAKVKDIELGQQGLSKNLSEANAASRAISAEGMEKQEVGYLLRMANYKLQSEADVIGATGLLKLAESKLLAANQGKADAMVDAVREKVIHLSGVKAVDTDALLSQLKSVSRNISKLQPKVSKATTATTTEQGATSNGVLDKITAVITSGVKYTPNDPSKIDISAETILIEKRLMQADVKTAELAVQSHNKVMLAESVKAISDSLDKFFAADETAKAIEKTLKTIAESELETVMPNLSGLVKQFESTQVQ